MDETKFKESAALKARRIMERRGERLALNEATAQESWARQCHRAQPLDAYYWSLVIAEVRKLLRLS